MSDNIDRIEEIYKKKYEMYERYIREDTDSLLEEINYYKSHNFEEIKKDIEEDLEELRRKMYNDMSMYPEDNHLLLEAYSKKTNDTRHGTDYLRNKIARKLSDEEKRELTIEYIEKSIESMRKSRLEEAKKKDILYDLMTKEQVDKYIELYYISEIKREAIISKKAAISDVESETGIVSDIDDLFISHQTKKIEKLLKVENQTKKEKEIKDKAISIASNLCKVVVGSAYSALTGGILTLIISTIIGLIADNEKLAEKLFYIGSPFIMAILFALLWTPNIRDFVSNKKAQEEAKKLGIYDLIIQSVDANKDYIEYQEELEEQCKTGDKNIAI